MAGSPDGWEVQHRCILSFRLYAFIWQSRYWGIFTLVLVLMERPSGISAGLSKTLEMFLGLLRSSLTPSVLGVGSGIPLITSAHVQAARVWSEAKTHLKMTCSGLGGWGGGGVQGYLGWRMGSGLLLLLSRGPLGFGKQFDGACYLSFRAVSPSIFQTPHSRWEEVTLLTVNYSRPVSPLRLWPLYRWFHIAACASLAVFGEFNNNNSTHRDKKKKSWYIRAFRCASPTINRTERCARHDINWCLLDICD